MSAWLEERRRQLSEVLSVDARDLAPGMAAAGAKGAYLARAILSARIPTQRQVAADLTALLIDPVSALAAIERDARRAPRRVRRCVVRVVDDLLVDVTDSATSRFTSGIQRVSRAVLRHWSEVAHFTPVVMTTYGVLRPATAEESARAGATGIRAHTGRIAFVPLGARLFLPEIATEQHRAGRLASIVQYGCAGSLGIGHDCIPMTTAETAPEGMPAAFAEYLAGLARFGRVVATSRASEAEFLGWASMLPAAGVAGPEIARVDLPIVPIEAEPESESDLRMALRIGDLPIVLVVGTHEPRKNHLAVLAAAELAWRRGGGFALVMVGSRSWESREFDRAVRRIERAGRSIRVLTGADDSRLAALYRAAVTSVFVSFNEGFGLPVAESLAAGTPVITADFGSQREIGERHGAMLVDVRDPRAIADAMLLALADPAAARAKVSAPESGDWGHYASSLLRLIV